MSLRDCINRAVRAGLMDRDRADFARNLFDENYDQARLGLGDAEALAKARSETLQVLRHVTAQQRREKLLQISRTKDILDAANRQAARDPERGFVDAMLAHLDPNERVDGVANVAKRRETIRGLLHENMDKFLADHARDLIGRTRNKAQLANVLQEIHGNRTGDDTAAEIAAAWRDTAERARKMFNAAGGDVPQLDGWALPHSHDFIAVRRAGFDKWWADISPRLDRAKMVDYSTGKPFTEFSLREAARTAFEDISTEGWNGRTAGGIYGQKLARRRLDHRFFIFKSADDWLAYHETYGTGDVFSVMMGHLDGMARDIASLQILGPNPNATLRWMGDEVEKHLRARALAKNAATDAFESRARGARYMLDGMWEQYTGAVNAPINGRAARTFAGLRSMLQSAQLGAAAVSAISDMGFAKLASSHVGLRYRNVIARQVRLLNPADKADKQLAVRLGLIAENWSTLAMAQQRYLGEVNGPELAHRFADFTMRVSGLSPWTQAGRWAFGMEFMGAMADHAGRAFKDLPEPMQRTFAHHGISSFDWDLARRGQLYEYEGAKFLRPDDIADEGVTFKFLDMIHSETEFAVPSTSLYGRARLLGGARPGTVQGEMIRSAAMYKNFAVTLMATHYRRFDALPTRFDKGVYLAKFMLATSIMGGLSLQLKEISKGRDPRDMTDPKFWGAAALQGGGLGIFGDFLFSQKNRYDKGLASTVAGPVVGLAGDVIGLFNENTAKAMEGKDTRVAAGVVDLAQRYMPGSSLWYTRGAFEHLLWDNLRKMADPKAEQRLKRIERRYKRDFGQDYWAPRTAGGSIRLPDLKAAFGG